MWKHTTGGLQISGGHKYLPPKQDVNAPDLYIPAMAVGTYCLLLCLSAAAGGKFKPEIMTSAVGSECKCRVGPGAYFTSKLDHWEYETIK